MTDYIQTHVFYLSSEQCDQGKGNYIQQITKAPGAKSKWEDNPDLRGAMICASGVSDVLYAVGRVAENPIEKYLRIGYVSAADNTLGEVYFGHSGWVSVVY